MSEIEASSSGAIGYPGDIDRTPGAIAQFVDIFKLRIGVFMALTALAGYAVTPGIRLDPLQLCLLALVVLAASGAAGAFNQFMERDLDARMVRTRTRPFVTGSVGHGRGWLWSIGMLLVTSMAMSAWLFNPAVALHLFLGAFFYGVVYTLWLKQRTPLNIVIGGASGSFAVLAGAAAADPIPGAAPVLLAVVLFLWTPPHFWALAIALRDDYAAAGVPMLPVVKGTATTARVILINTILLTGVSLLPVFFGMGYIYLAGAAAGGALFIFSAWRLTLEHPPSPRGAMQVFFASLLQLTLLMTGAMLDVLVAG
ncbi:MAG: heme o synthase [Pseudomonadales bacterium]|nr:heme o synthase [Pseudomonadales bacterium]